MRQGFLSGRNRIGSLGLVAFRYGLSVSGMRRQGLLSFSWLCSGTVGSKGLAPFSCIMHWKLQTVFHIICDIVTYFVQLYITAKNNSNSDIFNNINILKNFKELIKSS
jgi:hypothetical protein